MANVLVFCGAAAGREPHFTQLGAEVGGLLANHGCTLIYGGSRDGVMGAVANGVLANKGKVVGVLPHFLANREVAHNSADEMIFVNTMAERKEIMFAKCEMVLVLPGGLGTLDELFEALTLNQLQQMNKPVVILNHRGFYTGLLNWLESLQSAGFVGDIGERFVILHDVDGLKSFLS